MTSERAVEAVSRENGWEELRRLAEAATPGPWRVTHFSGGMSFGGPPAVYAGTDPEYGEPRKMPQTKADAALIVGAVNYVRSRLTATVPQDSPLGWWSTEGDNLTPEIADQMKPLLEEAVATGKQIVVVQGVTLRWHPAEQTGPGLDIERLATAFDNVTYEARDSFVGSRIMAERIAAEYDRLGLGRGRVTCSTPTH